MCSLACSIDLHSLESKELLHVRKYSGYCLDTVIVTVLSDLRINQNVDNCTLIWKGRPQERLVECWIYEKAGKHLQLDLYVINNYGSSRDNHFIFSSGGWRRIIFEQFHVLLRDLRLNSHSLAKTEYGEIVNDKYDQPLYSMKKYESPHPI
ncbi:hypothetical protein MACK_000868 [Theileria orientalis]|uniref:Uncharacterized protein n=1 Tax=Theileria orientalis TaxID=68886 RepID=A0A976MCD0_THEOR|nr:hypothetical protein MACK_000868 [Theileria orientalis]